MGVSLLCSEIKLHFVDLNSLNYFRWLCCRPIAFLLFKQLTRNTQPTRLLHSIKTRQIRTQANQGVTRQPGTLYNYILETFNESIKISLGAIRAEGEVSLIKNTMQCKNRYWTERRRAFKL